MALLDFQTALGRLVRAPDAMDPLRNLNLDARERSHIETLSASAGFKFAVKIQRSWCIGRAARSAYLTLSNLHAEERQRLLNEWVESGAGTRSFYETEAEAFFEFLLQHLIDPSHERTACELERATLRAREGEHCFFAPDLRKLDDSTIRLRRGRFAALVHFYCEPHVLSECLQRHESLPPSSSAVASYLFAPGLEHSCRPAAAHEVCVWNRLSVSSSIDAFVNEGPTRRTLEALLGCGAIEVETDHSRFS